MQLKYHEQHKFHGIKPSNSTDFQKSFTQINFQVIVRVLDAFNKIAEVFLIDT